MKILVWLFVILLVLSIGFNVVASNSSLESNKNYLPMVSKGNEVFNLDTSEQIINQSSKLLDAVPLVNNEILLIIQSNENNIVVYRYDINGASNFVDGWSSGIGTLVGVTVKGCVWVIVERDLGGEHSFIVHKVLNIECE